MTSKVYIMENLGCANCASKIERKIASLPGVQEVSITFSTRQLRLTAENPDTLLPEIQKIANSLEPDIIITERKRRISKHNAVAPTHESCSCGHDHEEHQHEHHHDHHPESCDCGHDHGEHHHEHHHDHESCDCGHDHGEHHHEHHPTARNLSENTKTIITIASGAVLFLLGEVLAHFGMELPSIIVLILGYLILGGKILLTAGKNMFKGHIFDENFLMSIATLGAFIIQEYPEAVGVMLFYRIGEFFEHLAVEKSRSQIMGAVDMRPDVVNLVSGSNIQIVNAEDVQIGDILLVRPGDRIPLDGIIIEGESRIDTSPVTGEPVPVKASVNTEVLSGCINTSGLIKIRVQKVLEDSMVSRILDSVENAAASKPKIDRFITRFARIYTPCVVILALGTAVIPSLFTGNWNYWVYTALSFLVMSCPCALVLSVPLAFFSGIGAGSKLGILFKGGIALEALTKVKIVIMDKTGTITKGNFTVQQVIPAENNISSDQLLTWCAQCELSSTHPIAHSIVTAAKEKNLHPSRPEQVEEIAGHGILAVLPEGTFLCGNKKLMERYGISMEDVKETSYGTEVFVAKDGRYIGCILISDTLKEDAKSAVARMKKLRITPAMLTGDAQENAQAVADAVGIEEVHARLLPQDKLTELQKIRNSHGAVMFVGDGINDAPVLAGADVGAAMGSGADAAIEAADVVFMTSKMDAIPQALAIARFATRISWQNVIFALAVKIFVMILGLAGFASMWMAVFADTGVAMLCVLNSIRILYKKS